MRKLIIPIIFLFTTISLCSQPIDSIGLVQLKEQIGKLQSELQNQKADFSKQISSANKEIKALQINIKSLSETQTKIADSLSIAIKETETNANQKITEIDQSLSKNSRYGIIGVLSAILLSGLLYWLLNKRQKTDKSEMIEQLSKTKSSIEESLVKEFGKQTDLIESELQLLTQQKKENTTKGNAKPDHLLALKVADEITLIERNISFMDKNVKGLKQLLRSVQKLKDNLSANGYEIPKLLGKQFHEGMKLIVVNSVPDENLQKGDEIISKIIKPQVNYDNKMIQPAQVEVSVG